MLKQAEGGEGIMHLFLERQEPSAAVPAVPLRGG